jgi:MFS transporter, putative metabolite transport protein
LSQSTASAAEEHGDQGFLRRLVLATACGEGLDGFDLGVLSVALPMLTPELGIQSGTADGAIWQGLILASSLVGIFFGAPIGGWVADKFGRKTVFFIDIILFVILGVVQAFVGEAWQLFVIRLLLGIAIGAEYSIGSSMLSEFIPAHGRGRRMSYMLMFWYGGYVLAVVLAYVMEDAGLSWRWILATSAVPALIVLGLRIGLPESPRWLMMKDRVTEARVIIDRYLGGEAHMKEADYDNDKSKNSGGWRDLFSPGLRSRTIFVSVFYICFVTPYFAIFNYAPTIFGTLGIAEKTSTISSNLLAFIGAIAGMLTIEWLGRRKQVIGPFWICALTLGIVGVVALIAGSTVSSGTAVVIVVCVAIFAFFNALMGNLSAVYPVEVFPTDLRATGVGVVNAFSRIGAAAGTFLLPLGVESIGIGWCMLIGAAMCVVGAVVSQVMAPETTGKSLTDTGNFVPVGAGAPGVAHA